jgi:hypothetical protein
MSTFISYYQTFVVFLTIISHTQERSARGEHD